ncbi:hypothetical protein [Haloarchaeobius sp. HRN-SO-5]|uniref:hypothetical protein n=1 Tax=Haloarchaeobius sp. HRN-SO-5 TaxID=3446118 RepID=UPI003EB9D8C7
MERRALLGRVGLGALAATAGCLDQFGDSTTRLADLSILTDHDEPHDLVVRVARDGEVRFDRRFDLPPASEHGTGENPEPVFDEPWMREPGRFVVSASLDGGEWRERAFPNSHSDGDCYGVIVRVGAGGGLDFPVDSHADGCAD